MQFAKIEIDLERSDWMQRPGRTATIHWGPFWFAVNTADGGILAFTVVFGRFLWGWHIEGNPDLP